MIASLHVNQARAVWQKPVLFCSLPWAVKLQAPNWLRRSFSGHLNRLGSPKVGVWPFQWGSAWTQVNNSGSDHPRNLNFELAGAEIGAKASGL